MLPRISPKNAAIREDPGFTGAIIAGLRKPAWARNDQCTHPVVVSME
jgi:hypothetical protein